MTTQDEISAQCIKDGGTCGVGGFCDDCPHVKSEISVETCVKWLEGYKRNMTWSGPLREHDGAIVDAAIAHLRHLQEVEAERDSLRTILDQHIAALRSTAWAITDKACSSADDIVAEAKRVRAELEKCRRDAERYKDALIEIGEYWNRDQNDRAMRDACWHAIDVVDAAISAGEGKDG